MSKGRVLLKYVHAGERMRVETINGIIGTLNELARVNKMLCSYCKSVVIFSSDGKCPNCGGVVKND